MKARLAGALASARERIGAPVELALILGSGLGDLADAVENPRVLPYAGIPGFPVSTAPGHAGELVAGTLFGRRVAVMRGRLHLYEGWTAQEVALGVRLLAGLGATRLVVTNAAGALNPELRARRRDADRGSSELHRAEPAHRAERPDRSACASRTCRAPTTPSSGALRWTPRKRPA